MVDSDGMVPVFVSYAWDDERSLRIVSQLESACNEDGGIQLIRDSGVLRYGDSITEYMNSLGAGDQIIAFVSQGFLRSEYCMYEMLQVQENGELRGRLYPVLLKDVRLSRWRDRKHWVDHWENEANECEDSMKKGRLAHRRGQSNDLDMLVDIANSASGLLEYISKHNNLSFENHIDGNFSEVIDRIKRDLEITSSLAPSTNMQIGGQQKRNEEGGTVSCAHTPINCAEICKEVGKILQREELGEFIPFLRKEGEDGARLVDILCGPSPDEAISRLNRALQGLLEARRDVQKPHFRKTLEQLAGWVALRAVKPDRLEPVIQGLAAGEKAWATVEIRDSVGVEIVVSFAQGREPEFKPGGESGVCGRKWVNTKLIKPDMGPEPQLEDQVAMIYDQVLRKQRPHYHEGKPDEREIRALKRELKAVVDDRHGAYYATGSLIGLNDDDRDRVDRHYRNLQQDLCHLKIVLTGGESGTGDLAPCSDELSFRITHFYEKLERIDGGNQKHE